MGSSAITASTISTTLKTCLLKQVKLKKTRLIEASRTVVEIDDIPHVLAAPVHHPIVPVEGQFEPQEVQKSCLSSVREEKEKPRQTTCPSQCKARIGERDSMVSPLGCIHGAVLETSTTLGNHTPPACAVNQTVASARREHKSKDKHIVHAIKRVAKTSGTSSLSPCVAVPTSSPPASTFH
jgi:hypothetical protein